MLNNFRTRAAGITSCTVVQQKQTRINSIDPVISRKLNKKLKQTRGYCISRTWEYGGGAEESDGRELEK